MSIWGRDWVQDELQPANTKIEVSWWETNAFSFSLHAEGGTRFSDSALGADGFEASFLPYLFS